jgi:hypothetical protein
MDLQIATNHEKIFWILILCISFSIFGQTKSDFFYFYKGGNNYKKPVKYVLLICPQEILKEIILQ